MRGKEKGFTKSVTEMEKWRGVEEKERAKQLPKRYLVSTMK
jgi:hypothetical protein